MVFRLMNNNAPQENSGKILLGTVEGEIHSIGKDIFKTLVRGHGFCVYDLGVDVSPSYFLSAIYDINPDIVGLSCLISGAYNYLRESIEFLRENISPSIWPRAYIVGGRINRLIAKSVGAEWWTSDAMEGVHLCKQIMTIP